MTNKLTKIQKKRLKEMKCPVKCGIVDSKIRTLSDYFALLTTVIDDKDTYWFRGHGSSEWGLVPSALRFKSSAKISTALGLLDEFQRIAEFKLRRPPGPYERLKWIQYAQHYGIPTRLLDWTESAIFALYFACKPIRSCKNQTGESDGMVFVLNPKHLLRVTKGKKYSNDFHHDDKVIDKYFGLGPKESKKGLPTIPIKPVWNSERLMMQRGVFTLHGSRNFGLDKYQAPFLLGIPILQEMKNHLKNELDRIGIDEMTMFPELEHTCEYLTRKAGL